MAEEQAVEETTEDAVEETTEEAKTEQTDDQETIEFESWRDLIEDEKLQKHAERFTSVDALVQANLESRQKLSKAVVRPDADADEEDVTAFREVMGVPKDVDGYEFPLPEGVERTEDMLDSEDHWANIFLDNNIPKETVPVYTYRKIGTNGILLICDVYRSTGLYFKNNDPNELFIHKNDKQIDSLEKVYEYADFINYADFSLAG